MNAVSGTPVDATTEVAWTELRRQAQLTDGFWLGFVLSPDPARANVLRDRAEALLRGRARSLVALRPATPEELAALGVRLTAGDLAEAGCVWVSVDVDDAGRKPPGPWAQAWDLFFRRVSVARDRLREHLHGGLVFAVPVPFKLIAREAAPDVWAVRSLVLELPAVAPGEKPHRGLEAPWNAARPWEPPSAQAPDPEVALAEAEVARTSGTRGREPLARALIRAAEGLVARGCADEARDRALEAVEVARGLEGREELLSRALSVLAATEEAEGDVAAAIAHLEESLNLMPAKHGNPWGRRTERLLDLLQALRLDRRGFEVTQAFVAASKAWGDADRDADLAQTIGAALGRAAYFAFREGDLGSARHAAEQSVERMRSVVALTGETPAALRSLSISLNGVGDVALATGDLSAARAAHEESLGLSRRLHLQNATGNTPDTLHDLSISLKKVGDAALAADDRNAARAAYEESLGLGRRLLETIGDTPEALRDLTIILDGVGDAARATGDRRAARAAYEESLKLRRRFRETADGAPEALRDLSASLIRIGDATLADGDRSAARAAYEESLGLDQRLRATIGDTPEVRRDLAVSYAKLGMLELAEGRRAAARTAFAEGLQLFRDVRASIGERPSILGELWSILEVLASVTDDPAAAEDLRTEAVDLAQQLGAASLAQQLAAADPREK